MTDVQIVIPARLHSTRLPEKVLLKETGKYLVQHVYERAQKIATPATVVVATDHEDVCEAVESFGGNVVMTSPDHPSGTDRAAEVARFWPRLPTERGPHPRLVVNLQADEPELEPADVDALIAAMGDALMGTLVYPALTDSDQVDRSVVKAIVEDGWATDFRREPTPGGQRHLGIYAYEARFLQRFTAFPPTERERQRRLEQMRALDNGVAIRAVEASHCGIGIDTPEDYAAFVKRWPAC